MTINDVLPLKVARDAIAKLKSLLGFESEMQTKPCTAVSFRFAAGRHVNAAYKACAMDWG